MPWPLRAKICSFPKLSLPPCFSGSPSWFRHFWLLLNSGPDPDSSLFSPSPLEAMPNYQTYHKNLLLTSSMYTESTSSSTALHLHCPLSELCLLLSCLFLSDSLRRSDCWPELLSPWDSSGKYIGVGYHSSSRAASGPRSWTCICYVSCRRWILY